MTTPTRDRWWYLTEPYEELLYVLGVTVVSTAPPADWPTDSDFIAAILSTPSGRIAYVAASHDLTGLEREYTVRGLLACWHGVDVSDWPVSLILTGERAR